MRTEEVFAMLVVGEPVPASRPRATKRRGGGVGVYTDPKYARWSANVASQARAHVENLSVQMGAEWHELAAPLCVEIVFQFKRPKSHIRSTKDFPDGFLKPIAPVFHMRTPDVDNLAKGVLDGLVRASVIADDRYVVRLDTRKVWAPPGGASCVAISINEMIVDELETEDGIDG